MSLLEKHGRKILLSVLLAILVYAALLFISDFNKLTAVLRSFRWELVPLILAFTVFNYGLRFIKWHYYLGLVGVKNVPWFDSLLIFLSGFSMTLTPAKGGELLKSFLVQQRVGAPIATTAPIILAERMTDGLAMLLLAATGLFLFDSPGVRLFMGLVVIAAVIAVALVQNRSLARRVGMWLARFKVLENRVHHLKAFYNSSYELLRIKSLAFAIGLGFVSWSGECIALALVLYGLGLSFSFELVILSAFAMGFATLAGSVLLTPGGLGVAEGSIDGLLLAFGRAPWLTVGEITQPMAAAATLMIRFATLWFGVALGFMCLFIWQRRFGATGQTVDTPRAVESEG
ncbi:MAG: lysylphosphatidylglycerol synthase transmembrane domain-containing protein [Anaerolineae bacterium]